MTTPVAFERVAVEPEALRLDGEMLPLRPAGDATAELTWRGTDYRIRPWTFGERRRLLSAHLGAGGEVDAASVANAALPLLVRPVPTEPEDRDVVGLAALAWSATAGERTPAPVPDVDPATQTVRLAAVTGWRPRDIDRAPAADVDRWFAALPGTAPGPAADQTAESAADQTADPAAHPATHQDDEAFRTFWLED